MLAEHLAAIMAFLRMQSCQIMSLRLWVRFSRFVKGILL